MKKTLLSLLSVFTAVILTFTGTFAAPVLSGSAGVSSETTQNGYEESTAEIPLLSGEGTVEQPYIIASVKDFAKAAVMIAEKNSLYGESVYSIVSCIDFGGANFKPLGNENAPFKGTLLGNNHRLINIECSDVSSFGVVGCMTKGSIQEVHAQYTDNEYAIKNVVNFGGIVGKIQAESSVNVDKCTATGIITFNSEKELNCGGIAGKVEAEVGNVYFNDCGADVSLSVYSENSDGYVGGFAGKCEAKSGSNFEMVHCFSYGDVLLETHKTSVYAAGFVSFANKDENGWSGWTDEGDGMLYATGDSSITNCFVTGNVKSSSNGGKVIANDATCLNVSKMYYSSAQTVEANNERNRGTKVTASNFRSSTYLSKTFGFDMKNLWSLGKDGKLKNSNMCADCVLPSFEISDTKVTVSDFDGEFSLAVASFTENVMTDIVFTYIGANDSVTFKELELDTDGADCVKAFLFEKDTLKPVYNSISVSL